MGMLELGYREVRMVMLEDTEFRTWLQLMSYALACQTGCPRICQSRDMRLGYRIGGLEVHLSKMLIENES